jgi:hypothetical protein
MNNRYHTASQPSNLQYGNLSNAKNAALQEHMEDENDSQVQLLHEKLSTLKAITIDIGQEVNDQNKFLDQFSLDMDKATGFLSGTMKRLKHMTREQSTRYILYFILFAFCIFVVFYILIL